MRIFLLALAATVLFAQDFGLVLRTSVGYITQRNSAKLSDEQKAEADRLLAEARKTGQTGDFKGALRMLHQGMALMAGIEWTPAAEFAASIHAKPETAVIEPGAAVDIRIASYYPVTRETPAMSAAAVLRPARGQSAPDKDLGSITPTPDKVPASLQVKLSGVEPGGYFLDVRIQEVGKPVPERARAAFVKTVPVQVASYPQLARLRERLAKLETKDSPAALSAEYSVDVYNQAVRGETNPHRYDFDAEFDRASAILDQLEKGANPLAAKPGDTRRVYRSPESGKLEPYRLFIPSQYDGAKNWPLVVALHGMGGNEDSMMDGYQGMIKREGERVGMIVAAPKGLNPTSMYSGDAEKDVLHVINEVKKTANIDTRRIYIMGHSMGGYGSWSIAMNHPDLFAALGPVAGGGNPARMARIKHIPQYVIHGDADPTVSVDQSRAMVKAGREAGANIEYVEVKGGNHGNIVPPGIGPMFDFFARQAKPASTN
ncbi:MAG: hypothetical protein FJW39_35405 [Acidobacteria bacterium]|nr:hypothetical protein [Acidobacteriota bacterium]